MKDILFGTLFGILAYAVILLSLYHMQQKEQIRKLQRRVNAISEAVQEGRRHIELEPN